MENKITIHCKTSRDWEMVQERIGYSFTRDFPEEYQPHVGICIGGHYDKMYGRIDKHQLEGYIVMPASEYLNEGGKDVKELIKEGDQVEITGIQDGEDYRGLILEVTTGNKRREEGVTCRTPEGHTWYFEQGNFKILTNKSTKPKKTKENNMKENNTDSAVLATFGSKVNGDELVVIDRHFTDNMLKKILMEKHHKAIQEACEVAEAKWLEKESKE